MMIHGMSFGITLLALAGLLFPTRPYASVKAPETPEKAKQTNHDVDSKAEPDDPGTSPPRDSSNRKNTRQNAKRDTSRPAGPVKAAPRGRQTRAATRDAGETPRGEPETFIDRDGDGIHDGKEHRFRRGRGRRGLRFGHGSPTRLQEGTRERQREREGGEGGEQRRQGQGDEAGRQGFKGGNVRGR